MVTAAELKLPEAELERAGPTNWDLLFSHLFSRMDEINQSLSIIGYNEGDKLEMRELRKVFKKKSLSMLPEKHPTVPNAYQRFEEINSSFVKGRELFAL